MSTAPFGQIQYEEEPQHDASQQSNGAAAPQEVIDINDPRLTSESLTFNPEGDAYAMRPVLPAGKWRAKLKAVQPRDKGLREGQYAYGTKNRDGQLFLATNVEASIIDHSGRYDGIPLTDYYVTTEVRKDGTMQAATILGKLGKPARGGSQHKAIMDQLLGALAGEPEAGVDVDWEWSCQACEKLAKEKGERKPRSFRGMHNFPQIKDPADPKRMIHDPQRKCDIVPSHGVSVARPRITRYLSLAEVGK